MRTTPAHRPIQLTRTIFTDINTNTTHSPLQANTNCSELRGWAGTRGRGGGGGGGGRVVTGYQCFDNNDEVHINVLELIFMSSSRELSGCQHYVLLSTKGNPFHVTRSKSVTKCPLSYVFCRTHLPQICTLHT